MKLARCPYCGRRISYFSAILHKDEGEYICKRCRRESRIIIKKQIFALFIISLIFSSLILGCFLIFTDKTNIWGVFFVGLPFIIFYFMTPGFLMLMPLKKYKKSQDFKQRSSKRAMMEDSFGFDNEANIYQRPKERIDEYKKPIDQEIFYNIKKGRKKNIAGQKSSKREYSNYNNDDAMSYK